MKHEASPHFSQFARAHTQSSRSHKQLPSLFYHDERSLPPLIPHCDSSLCFDWCRTKGQGESLSCSKLFNPRRLSENLFLSMTPFSLLSFPFQAHTSKENFFSDPSTYPLIIIMGFAVTFMTGMGINALVSYKDVQIDPAKRNAKMQTWGQEDQPSKLSYAVHWNSYQKNMPEGLGINHEEWKASKAAKSDSEQAA